MTTYNRSVDYYCAYNLAGFSNQELTSRSLDLETSIQHHQQLVKTMTSELSAITAALKLRRFAFRPGDVIGVPRLRRVRIENESIDGVPVGQPVDENGVPHGRVVLLTDDHLVPARLL